MEVTHCDDTELLTRLRSGDEDAFNLLYDKYWKLLWQLAYKKTGDLNEAKDIAQELFLDIWNRRRKLNVTGPLKTYLIAVLYIKIFRFFKKKGFQAAHYEQFEQFLVRTGQDIEQVMLALDKEEQVLGKLQEIIDATIAQMPPQMQKVFVLKHYSHLSNQEIAAQLNLSVNTVKNHLKTGVQRMRKAGDTSSQATLVLLISILEEIR